jgi:hypothetical protein
VDSVQKDGHTRNWELKMAGGICILISLLHLLGLFEKAWLVERISTITLLVLGLFIMFLTRVLERVDNRQDLNDLESAVNNLITGNKTNQDGLVANLGEVKEMLTDFLTRYPKAGVEIHQFENVGNVYDYISSKLREARQGVKDITWGSYTGYRTEREQTCYDNYVKTIESVCKKDIVYEEISSLSDEHYFRRSTNLLTYYNYHLAFHDISCISVPLISYVIIDSQEVILGFCRVSGVTRPLDNIVYLSVTNPMLVRFFFDYFTSIWHQAIKLKESNQVNKEKIKEIGIKLGIN